jgi:hypothetical protein
LGFAWFVDYGDVDHGFMLKRSSSRRFPITYCLFNCLYLRLLESVCGRIHFPSEEYTCLDLAINLVVHILILILCLTPAMHNLVGLFF